MDEGRTLKEVEQIHEEETARVERLIRFKEDNPNVECILEASQKQVAWAERWLAMRKQ